VVVTKYIFNINKEAGYQCKTNLKISNEVSYRVKSIPNMCSKVSSD